MRCRCLFNCGVRSTHDSPWASEAGLHDRDGQHSSHTQGVICHDGLEHQQANNGWKSAYISETQHRKVGFTERVSLLAIGLTFSIDQIFPLFLDLLAFTALSVAVTRVMVDEKEKKERGRANGQQPPQPAAGPSTRSTQSPAPARAPTFERVASQSLAPKQPPSRSSSKDSTTSSKTAFKAEGDDGTVLLPLRVHKDPKKASPPPRREPKEEKKAAAIREARLLNWIKTDSFNEDSDHGVKILTHLKYNFQPPELRKGMKYAYDLAKEAMDENVRLRAILHVSCGTGTLNDFVDYRDDNNRRIMNLVQQLPAWIENDEPLLHKEHRFNRTLVVVAKAYHRAKEENERLENEMKGLARIYAWIDDPKRIEYRELAYPIGLREDKFSDAEIKDGAVHALARGREAAHKYKYLAKQATVYILENKHRSKEEKAISKTLVKRQEDLVPTVTSPRTDIWGMNFDDIRDMQISGDSEYEDPEDKESDVMQMYYFRPSVALLAKTVHEIEALCEKLEREIKKYPQTSAY